jgi:hypothetical protein
MDNGQATTLVVGPGLADRAVGGLTAFAITIFATVVLLYFLLANGRRTVGRMLVAITVPERRERWGMVIDQIQSEIAAYLLMVTVINVVLGLAVGVAMMALGMPNPILWGVLTVLANFLPYVGPLAMFVIIGVTSDSAKRSASVSSRNGPPNGRADPQTTTNSVPSRVARDRMTTSWLDVRGIAVRSVYSEAASRGGGATRAVPVSRAAARASTITLQHLRDVFRQPPTQSELTERPGRVIGGGHRRSGLRRNMRS